MEEAAKKAIAAFSDLISELLVVGRFQEVKRLITIGISLQRVKKQSAEDYIAREEQEGAFDENGLVVNPVIRGGNIIGVNAGAYNWGAGNDAQNLTRELLLMLEKTNAKKEEKADAEAARDEASELLSLQDVLKDLPPDSPHRGPLGNRIDQLVNNIAERSASYEHPPVI